MSSSKMQDVESHTGQLSAWDDCNAMVSLEIKHAHNALEGMQQLRWPCPIH